MEGLLTQAQDTLSTALTSVKVGLEELNPNELGALSKTALDLMGIVATLNREILAKQDMDAHVAAWLRGEHEGRA